MPDTTANIRALPIYQLAFSAGIDLGLAIALHAITDERSHQERLTDGSPTCRVYADGCLLAVSKSLAARFRQ
jgi:hypothetical protein